MIEEVLSFTREYINNPRSRTRERKDKIRAAYKKLTGESLVTNCGTCLIETLFKIKRLMEKQPSKYLLKPGALRTPIFGDISKQFTNDNITDELAELDLRLNPGARIYYSRIPDPEILEPVKEAAKKSEVFEVKKTRSKRSKK